MHQRAGWHWRSEDRRSFETFTRPVTRPVDFPPSALRKGAPCPRRPALAPVDDRRPWDGRRALDTGPVGGRTFTTGVPRSTNRQGAFMKFAYFTDEPAQIKTDLVGVLCFEDRPGEGALYQGLDRALDGLLGRVAPEER